MADSAMDSLFSVAGKRVMITGGTAGIGLGLAKHFAEAGSQVAVFGRRDDGTKIAASIGAAFFSMDVTDEQSVDTAFKAALHALGGVNVLILNAGIDLPHGRVDALNRDAFRKTLDVNILGCVNVMSAAAGHLGAGASVILSSSPASQLFKSEMAAYSASKAAVNALVQSWAVELAPQGIRVNAVLPGLVESEMSGSSGAASFIRALTLNGQHREPHEVAGVYQFLASKAADSVTAAIIAADDGLRGGLSEAAVEHIAAATLGAQSSH